MGFSTDRERWQALCLRTPAAHTSFIYAVITTRIFCRPTCSARLARRANIIFFDTATDAAQAGFRACKRCKPNLANQPAAQEHRLAVVRHACEIIQDCSGEITPETVAKQVGLSLRYFHGIFKQVTGLTPTNYAKQCRQWLSTDTMASSELARSLIAPFAASCNSPSAVSISPVIEPGLAYDLDEREMAELASIMARPDVFAKEIDSFLVDDSTAPDNTMKGLSQGPNMVHSRDDGLVPGEEGRAEYLAWPDSSQEGTVVGLDESLIMYGG